MKKRETESGVLNIFQSSITDSAISILSETQKRQIIDHFNRPPILAEADHAQFREDWKDLLEGVLHAAVTGITRCLAYFKNPGRELRLIIPDELLDTLVLYVRGCSLGG